MPEVKDAPAIRPDNYRFLQEHIRKQSGIVLDETKHYLVEARLLPIALDEGLRNLDDLCAKLRQPGPATLQRRVIEAMTTNETYFFREPTHFEALKTTILPPLIAARKDSSRKLSIWSAAASTGQEAYSIAMMLAEMGLQDWDITIVGTDLAENVLEKAKESKYSQLEVNRGLPVTMLVKYFTRQQLLWELKPVIRKMVRFQALDLRNVRGVGPFDVALCRNVLIYFDLDTKLQIVDQIRTTLNPGGHFFLGASEVGLAVGPRFNRVCSNDATYYQAL